ncbi:VOC family protein [Streptomyces sp. PT12]|uniref:VOC family protein n=1 Tax=Streptomyces sp. PT12 TaxID=1510197 RepID=UPI000DE32BE7|nr:VOC family protein [Streptomyces sp. PT12]RBM07341.1 glyoxalase [Streptomyces sp. PT12]
MTDDARRPRIGRPSTVLDSPDARALARFYERLLGWDVIADEPDWAQLAEPGGPGRLSFQTEGAYERPQWPTRPGRPQIGMHLDLEVDDLERAVAHAEAVGAVLAPFQPRPDVRVCLDPAGHPFCLWVRD